MDNDKYFSLVLEAIELAMSHKDVKITAGVSPCQRTD